MSEEIDRGFQLMLLQMFHEPVARGIYGIVIDIIAFFKKTGIFLSLPIVFLKEWRKSYQEHSRNK